MYIDYNTLQNAAFANGLQAELILEGEHYDFLENLQTKRYSILRHKKPNNNCCLALMNSLRNINIYVFEETLSILVTHNIIHNFISCCIQIKSHCHLLFCLFFRKNKIMFIKYDNLQLMCIIIHRLGGFIFFGDKQINPMSLWISSEVSMNFFHFL
jgi:hypothetical protein